MIAYLLIGFVIGFWGLLIALSLGAAAKEGDRITRQNLRQWEWEAGDRRYDR